MPVVLAHSALSIHFSEARQTFGRLVLDAIAPEKWAIEKAIDRSVKAAKAHDWRLVYATSVKVRPLT